MHTIATLMTPHIGIASIGQSSLMRAGVDIYSRVSSHMAVKQMSLRDAKNPKDCYLVKLATLPGLDWFKHVLLFSSYQDYYSPYDSARIELGAWQKEKGYQIQKQMVEDLLSKLESNKVVRIDVNFKIAKSWDSILGRKAHMMLIDDFVSQEILVYFYSKYFI